MICVVLFFFYFDRLVVSEMYILLLNFNFIKIILVDLRIYFWFGFVVVDEFVLIIYDDSILVFLNFLNFFSKYSYFFIE